jgi:hypothetical protein
MSISQLTDTTVPDIPDLIVEPFETYGKENRIRWWM